MNSRNATLVTAKQLSWKCPNVAKRHINSCALFSFLDGTSMPTNRSSVAGPSHMTSHEHHMTPNSHTHSGIDPYVLSHHMEKLQIDNKLQRSLDLVR